MSSKKLFPLALVSALLLSTAVLAQGGGGGGGGGGVVLVLVEQVPVVPVEVVALAVLPAQAARQILQARPGAAGPILQQAIRTPEVWTPTPMV